MTDATPGAPRRAPRRTHAPYDELVAGYALDALEPEDEQQLLAHLPTCARCREELAEQQESLVHLVGGLGTEEPPPSLLAGIRAAIDADAGGSAATATQDPDPAVVPLSVGRERRERRERSRWAPRGRNLVSAAAAVALLASVTVWGTQLVQERDAASDRFAALVAALEVDDPRTVPLKSADGSVDAVAVLGERGGRQVVAVVSDGLDPNDASAETYVLWAAMRFGDVRPVGAFDVGRKAGVVAELPLQASATELAGFAVTVEPGRTAPALPSTAPLVSGELRSGDGA